MSDSTTKKVKGSLPSVSSPAKQAPAGFQVGQGVHWNVGGDTYPGTVQAVSANGSKVYVSKDTYKVIDGEAHTTEGPRGCEFQSHVRPVSELVVFKFRPKSSSFTDAPGRHCSTLHPEKRFAWDPHF